MGRWLLPLLFLSLCGACTQAPAGPAEVYQAFHGAIAAGDWDRAVGYLAPETRDAFRAVGEQLTATVGQDEDPLAFFLRGVRAEVMRPLREIKIVSEDGSAAMLQVVAGPCQQEEGAQAEDAGPDGETVNCSVSRVELVRVENRWLIRADLPRAFRDSAAAVRGG